ncbi:MAG: MOSC domain-containing protein [Betaproteobacteria bacterium]|nr:MAG: MOSC domain-containing protein [Betaproteobacteria bacterium]
MACRFAFKQRLIRKSIALCLFTLLPLSVKDGPIVNPDSEMAKLMATFPRPGVVQWIGVRSERRAPLLALDEVEAVAGHGLAGDHYSSRTNGKRQVTLIQQEHLAVVAQLLGKAEVLAESVRRNIVVSGINLYALRDRRFRIGEVSLEGTGTCDPCSRMEEVLGTGGYNAMRGHGGIVCRILEGGTIRLGDAVIGQ